jgi:DNA replicative helicase MCM subunit Mcm2 (Cdc46/Mcm family)
MQICGTRDLTYGMSFLTCSARQADEQAPDKAVTHLMRSSKDLSGRLARSIVPNVFAHEEVKRGILLMLLGGCRSGHSTT